MKARLLEYFLATGQQKAKTAEGLDIRVQANGGVLPLLIADPRLIPEEYKYTPPAVADNDKIRKAIEAGYVLPFASLGERGVHVRIP